MAADPFPRRIEVRPGRRRSVQLSLEDGRFVARVPARAAGPKLDATLGELRRQLWARLRRESVWTDDDLHDLAREVADAHLSDLDLPPWTTRFSRRQNKRWGSCTFDGREGRDHTCQRPWWMPPWM